LVWQTCSSHWLHPAQQKSQFKHLEKNTKIDGCQQISPTPQPPTPQRLFSETGCHPVNPPVPEEQVQARSESKTSSRKRQRWGCCMRNEKIEDNSFYRHRRPAAATTKYHYNISYAVTLLERLERSF
jgi:hypothetical protein